MRLTHVTSRYRAKLIANVYYGWLKNNSKTLDIGCGTGVVTKELANKFHSQMTGCDVDKYLATKVNFVKMRSNTKLPFNKNQFDAAMFNDVLHHTQYSDQIKLLKEAERVSKEVLIFELKPTKLGKLFDFLLNKIHNPRMTIPYTYRTQKDWQKLFQNLGYKVSTKSVSSPFWYPFKHVAFRVTSK